MATWGGRGIGGRGGYGRVPTSAHPTWALNKTQCGIFLLRKEWSRERGEHPTARSVACTEPPAVLRRCCRRTSERGRLTRPTRTNPNRNYPVLVGLCYRVTRYQDFFSAKIIRYVWFGLVDLLFLLSLYDPKTNNSWYPLNNPIYKK